MRLVALFLFALAAVAQPMRDLHIRVGPSAPPPFLGRIANLDAVEAPREPVVIRLLVVYMPEAETQLGDADKVRSDVAIGVKQVNRTLAATGIAATVELAGAMRIDRPCSTWETCQFTRTDSMQFFHAALAADVGVKHWRDALDADIVVGWTWSYDGQIAGVSYILNSLVPIKGKWEPSEYGYAVVAAQYAVSWPVLVHELGHIFGLAHNIEATQGPGLTPYAYGWRDPLDRFQDPMTIGPCPIGWWFSSASRLFDGVPTGGPNADAERVLAYSLPRVACYRGPCNIKDFVAPWK